MEIVGNSKGRVEITHNLLAGDIVGFLMMIFLGSLLLAIGSSCLFVEAADILAPNWAEIRGWSGDRWHFGTGEELFEWDAENGTPLSHFWSILMSVLMAAISLFIVSCGAMVFVSTRQRLVFDLDSGQLVLSRRGLFQLSDQTFALSAISARIDTGTDEAGELYHMLSVTVRRAEGQSTLSGRRPWTKTLFLEKCTPDQVLALDGLLEAAPDTTQPLPLPPKAAPAS
jgi:hypothetical protein